MWKKLYNLYTKHKISFQFYFMVIFVAALFMTCLIEWRWPTPTELLFAMVLSSDGRMSLLEEELKEIHAKQNLIEAVEKVKKFFENSDTNKSIDTAEKN